MGGDGLFGCMLADPAWKEDAEVFMEKVRKLQDAAKKKRKKMVPPKPREATEQPRAGSELRVRFTMYCDDKEASMYVLLVLCCCAPASACSSWLTLLSAQSICDGASVLLAALPGARAPAC